jgi:hypothetical protein
MNPEEAQARVATYRKTIARAWACGDQNTWPVKLNASFHLFAKEFGEELLADIATLEAQGRTPAEIAKPFYNPSRMYRLIDVTIYSLRRNGRSLAEQRAAALKLLDLTRALKYGSEFNEDGRNIIYDPDTAAAVVPARLDEPVRDLAQAQVVHRFCALMWSYTESVCFRAHDLTKEIHGPYPVDGGRAQFIVQEYLNLHPTELWPDMPMLPCQTIKVYKQYSNDVRLTLDPLNHLYHEGGQLVPSLQRCAVEVDGERRDVNVLADYLRASQRTIAAISKAVNAMSWNDRVQKYADIFWWRKKPLRDQLGRSWRVTESVREAISRGHENERRRLPLTNEASERLAMLTI